MMQKIEERIQRADNRPGYKIVNYREVALPVFRVHPLISIQVEREVGPVEQFVLRAIGLDIGVSDEISYFLGLPEVVVKKQIGAFLYEGLIAEDGERPNHYKVTPTGADRLAGLIRSDVEKAVIPLYVDGFTREVIPVEADKLYASRELKEMGVEALPPIPRRPPLGAELSLSQINRLLAVRSKKDIIGRRVIRVDALAGKTRMLFRPGFAVAFKSENGRDISIGFIIDGIVSKEHEAIYMRSEDPRRSIVFSTMFDVKRRRENIRDANRELQAEVPSVLDDPDSQRTGRRKPTLTLGVRQSPISAAVRPSLVRTLSVYEHPPLLERALTTARERLLIISPWIRANVVDDAFIDSLRSRLSSGVYVTIAYGLGREDKELRHRDLQAIRRLADLTEEFSSFKMLNRGNTHAKVLIMDAEFFVTTSFNWLSFRGDPRQPFREEEGTYVSGREIVDAYYSRLLARMDPAPK